MLIKDLIKTSFPCKARSSPLALSILRSCVWLLLLLGPLTHKPVEGQYLRSPCPDVFSYRRELGTNLLFGYVELRGLHVEQMLKLHIELSISIAVSQNETGSITLAKSKEETLRDIYTHQTAEYRVNFPLYNVIPRVIAVSINDETICTEHKLAYLAGNSINLEHTLFTQKLPKTNTKDKTNINGIQFQATPQRQLRPQLVQNSTPNTGKTPSEHYSSSIGDGSANIGCGQPAPFFNRLSINGIRSLKGQFPWASPVFDASQQSKPKYICGSTIITERHLVTAAHCMYTSNGIERSACDLTTVPGMYNIDNFMDSGLQQRNGKQIFIHEDYYHEDTVLLDSDIAVILVDEPLEFNDLVRPICLWTESDSLERIVGVKGFVSGWGVTENADAKYPSYVTATVVDRYSCSNNLNIRIGESDRVLCADGYGSVPCNGDTGSGFVIRRGKKYYIRGIVAVGQFDPNMLTCARNKYVVYTDIAPFRHWLRKVIHY